MNVRVLALLAATIACSGSGEVSAPGAAAKPGTPPELAGGPRSDWPEGFTWDVQRYPQLAAIPLGPDGMPADQELRPGPDGLPDKLKALLGMATGNATAVTGPPAQELRGDTPDPPEDLRCVHRESPHACYSKVDAATLRVGAQATAPSAPGYDADAYENEGPPHEVAVAPFWIMRFEADVALVMRCVAKGWCPPAMAERQAQGDGTEKMGAQNAPARNVTWAEADRACSFIGARLPTEAEWELAARGTDGRRWPWGNLPACGVSWPHGSPILNKEQVGDPELEALMRPPCELPVPRSVGLGVGRSPYLLLAMAGNVAEWTSDLYAPYTPQGRGAPAEGERRRVTRGGGWLDADPRDLRATVRVPVDAETWMPDVGFRCVWGRMDGG